MTPQVFQVVLGASGKILEKELIPETDQINVQD